MSKSLKISILSEKPLKMGKVRVKDRADKAKTIKNSGFLVKNTQKTGKVRVNSNKIVEDLINFRLKREISYYNILNFNEVWLENEK